MKHAQGYGISYTILIAKFQQRVGVLELGVDEKIILKFTSAM
jgi:hypothetical protein